jgi:hypothetical protein
VIIGGLVPATGHVPDRLHRELHPAMIPTAVQANALGA